MSKPVEGPGPLPAVPAWDDAVGGEELARPDASFHDDHVGGRLKSEEAARKRAVSDRFMQQQPRRIARETERIAEAGAFRPTHEDEAQRRARAQLGREASRARRRAAGVAARPLTAQEEDVARLEARVELLMASMEAVDDALSGRGHGRAADEAEAQLDAGAEQGDEGQDGEDGEDGRVETQRAQLEARLRKLEREAKHQLQHLVAGGAGLTFMADPRLTFRRLFARIAVWPRGVRPGYRPETEADIDAFLAWVFEPAEGYGALEPF